MGIRNRCECRIFRTTLSGACDVLHSLQKKIKRMRDGSPFGISAARESGVGDYGDANCPLSTAEALSERAR